MHAEPDYAAADIIGCLVAGQASRVCVVRGWSDVEQRTTDFAANHNLDAAWQDPGALPNVWGANPQWFEASPAAARRANHGNHAH